MRRELSKNKQARQLPLSGEVLAIFGRAYAARRFDCPNVFHRDGVAIRSFRKSWSHALRDAGLGHVLIHDLRRSAIRNLIRAGVPDRIAMTVSGHKTRAILDRYNIVSGDDAAKAMIAMENYLAKQAETAPAPVVQRLERPEKAA